MAKSRFIIKKTPSRKKERTVTVRDSEGNVEKFRTDRSGNVDLRSPASRSAARVSSSRSDDPQQVIQGGVTIPVSEGFAKKIKEVTAQPSKQRVSVKGEPEPPSEFVRLAQTEERQGVRVNRIRQVAARIGDKVTPRERRIQTFRQEVAEQRARKEKPFPFRVSPTEDAVNQTREAAVVRVGNLGPVVGGDPIRAYDAFKKVAKRGLLSSDQIFSDYERYNKQSNIEKGRIQKFVERASLGYAAGTIEQVRDQPLLLPSLYGGGRAGGAVFTGGRAALGKFLSKIPGAAKVGRGAAVTYEAVPLPKSIKFFTPKAVLAGAIAAPVAINTLQAEQGKRTQQLAKELNALAAVGVGVQAGARDTGKILSRISSRGTTNVPTEQIVAPEFFAGQKYPAVKPDQTAGQLLKEFRANQKFLDTFSKQQSKSAAEINRILNRRGGAGFTAAPQGFKRNFIVQPGSSELEGLYTAPRVSPAFLKVATKETSFFDLSLPKAPEPTILFSEAEVAALARGVSKNQRSLAGLQQIQKQFKTFETEQSKLNTQLRKGTLNVPFIKTEKEAVVPAGTIGRVLRKRFNINYEGFRIPIQEADLVYGGAVPKQVSKLNAQINKAVRRGAQRVSSSSGTPRGRGVVNPLSSSLSSAQQKLMSSLQSNIQRYYSTSSAPSSIGSRSSSIPPSTPPYTPPRRPSRRPRSSSVYTPPRIPTYRIPSSPRGSSTRTPPSSPPYSPPRVPPYTPPSKPPASPKIPEYRTSDVRKEIEKYRARSRGFRIPSLTGFATGFRLPDTGVPTISPRFLRPKVRRA